MRFLSACMSVYTTCVYYVYTCAYLVYTCVYLDAQGSQEKDSDSTGTEVTDGREPP